jgi:flagellar motility protein MotE (MotC chaperone)
MMPIFPFVPLLFMAAVALPAAAQTTAPAPAASPTSTEPTKQCVTARKREDREQRSLTAATDAIARDRKARESCSSKSMCARYDTAISAMEKRQARHETRLTRFKEDVDKACKTS